MLGWQNASVGKGTCQQASKPEFGPQDIHGEGREPSMAIVPHELLSDLQGVGIKGVHHCFWLIESSYTKLTSNWGHRLSVLSRQNSYGLSWISILFVYSRPCTERGKE